MSNEYTSDYIHPDGLPAMLPHLPGIYGYGNYVDLQFVLDEFIDVGAEVIFGFRYMTDWSAVYPGWYIVSATVINGEDVQAELDLIPVYPELDFMVSIVSKYKVFGHTFYHVRDMKLSDLTEFGCTLFLDTKWKEVTVVVSPMGVAGSADYSFKVSRLRGRHRCCW